MLCVGFSVCSKQPDFDAKSYVQSSLEAVYHGTYADYALLMEIFRRGDCNLYREATCTF
jgi:hypothetical protein